jgi:hypothetical protein
MIGGTLALRTKKALFPKENKAFSKWAEGDLNPRHQDFQSCALPTELSALVF